MITERRGHRLGSGASRSRIVRNRTAAWSDTSPIAIHASEKIPPQSATSQAIGDIAIRVARRSRRVGPERDAERLRRTEEADRKAAHADPAADDDLRVAALVPSLVETV